MSLTVIALPMLIVGLAIFIPSMAYAWWRGRLPRASKVLFLIGLGLCAAGLVGWLLA